VRRLWLHFHDPPRTETQITSHEATEPEPEVCPRITRITRMEGKE